MSSNPAFLNRLFPRLSRKERLSIKFPEVEGEFVDAEEKGVKTNKRFFFVSEAYVYEYFPQVALPVLIKYTWNFTVCSESSAKEK